MNPENMVWGENPKVALESYMVVIYGKMYLQAMPYAKC